MRALLVLAAASAALAACATPMGGRDYEGKLDAHSSQCKARGGILTPTGANRGEPEIDYACTITGGASRIGNN